MRTDDQASRAEAHFLDAALRAQRAAAVSASPGRCANCREPCLPRAVYCDEGCRDDHERRLCASARRGEFAR
jgi:hypothetical protein